jgi:hypothetical protein
MPTLMLDRLRGKGSGSAGRHNPAAPAEPLSPTPREAGAGDLRSNADCGGAHRRTVREVHGRAFLGTPWLCRPRPPGSLTPQGNPRSSRHNQEVGIVGVISCGCQLRGRGRTLPLEACRRSRLSGPAWLISPRRRIRPATCPRRCAATGCAWTRAMPGWTLALQHLTEPVVGQGAIWPIHRRR